MCVSNAQGPNGLGIGKCPARGYCKICKCPTPGTDKAGKFPAVAWSGGGGGVLGPGAIDWCIIYNLSGGPAHNGAYAYHSGVWYSTNNNLTYWQLKWTLILYDEPFTHHFDLLRSSLP